MPAKTMERPEKVAFAVVIFFIAAPHKITSFCSLTLATTLQ
jgi:hypothetical protein